MVLWIPEENTTMDSRSVSGRCQTAPEAAAIVGASDRV